MIFIFKTVILWKRKEREIKSERGKQIPYINAQMWNLEKWYQWSYLQGRSGECHLSQWCHPTISFSAAHFSSCSQSFSVPGSLPISCLFTSGGQSIRVSATTPVLPMNTQGWFPLGLTGLISFMVKGLSRVFSSMAFQKHQFFSEF